MCLLPASSCTVHTVPESGREYCISRAPDYHNKDPGFSSRVGKTNSTFFECLATALVKDCFEGGALVYNFRFLAKVTRGVLLNSKIFYGKPSQTSKVEIFSECH